jgi:hypothetical protein
MGTSKSTAQFVGKINDLGTFTKRRQVASVNEGALTAKTIMLASAAAKGLTPASKLAGKKWSVRYTVKGTDNPEALVRYTGPFHLFDNPTKAHELTPKLDRTGKRTRGRGGKRALNIGGNIRANASHPGTPGARSFPVAKITAHARVPRVMANVIRGGWLEAMK